MNDPRFPSLTKIVSKHWRAMTTNPTMASIFKDPPLIAYKRPKNLKDILIRARIPPPQSSRPKRIKTGMSKCNKPCSICPYIRKQNIVKSSTNIPGISDHAIIITDMDTKSHYQKTKATKRFT